MTATADATVFDVNPDCPYYDWPDVGTYRHMAVTFDAAGNVLAVLGPFEEPYTRSP